MLQKGFLQTVSTGKDLLLLPFQAKQMGLQVLCTYTRKFSNLWHHFLLQQETE